MRLGRYVCGFCWRECHVTFAVGPKVTVCAKCKRGGVPELYEKLRPKVAA